MKGSLLQLQLKVLKTLGQPACFARFVVNKTKTEPDLIMATNFYGSFDGDGDEDRADNESEVNSGEEEEVICLLLYMLFVHD